MGCIFSTRSEGKLLAEIGTYDWRYYQIKLWDADAHFIHLSALEARQLMILLPKAILDCDTANHEEGRIVARKYELNVTIEADDFESMLNLLHVIFQDVAAGTIEASGRGATADGVLTIAGSAEAMEEYRQGYLSYRDAADEEA